jgi:hypothetical protein
LLDEMPNEQRNVFRGFAQGRNGNRENIQPVVEIKAVVTGRAFDPPRDLVPRVLAFTGRTAMLVCRRSRSA